MRLFKSSHALKILGSKHQGLNLQSSKKDLHQNSTQWYEPNSVYYESGHYKRTNRLLILRIVLRLETEEKRELALPLIDGLDYIKSKAS